MFTVDQTKQFQEWFGNLRDPLARKQIAKRITFAQAGHFGDCESVGGKVSEMRIFTGPGYRLYFTRIGGALIVLLVGGDKGSQGRDIEEAKAIAAALHSERI